MAPPLSEVPTSAPAILPPLEDLPLETAPPIPPSSAGGLRAVATQEERAAALVQAITSELSSADIPLDGAASPSPPVESPNRLSNPLVSGEGIMVFVPDIPITEGILGEEPPPDRPPSQPIDRAELAASPQLNRIRRPSIAAGHGVAKRAEASAGGGSLLLWIAIPTVLLVAIAVVLVVVLK